MSVSIAATNGNFLKGTTNMPALTGSWTVAVWSALTLSGTIGDMISIENAGPTQFIQFLTNGTRAPQFLDTAIATAFPGGNFTDGAWNFYAAARTSGTNTVVLSRGANGAALSTKSVGSDTTSFTPTAALMFNENGNDEPINGNILGFMIWTAALTAREIANQYLSLTPVSRLDALNRWIPAVDSTTPGTAYFGRNSTLTKTGTLTASHKMPSVPWYQPQLLMM